MNPKPRKRYTPEFKAQAVALIRAGKPVPQIAEELCIGRNLLYQGNWTRALRRENSLLKQENDILKKAAVILGTRPQLNSGK